MPPMLCCLARVKTRAWIETTSPWPQAQATTVSLGLKPGRGLKPFAVVPEGYRIERLARVKTRAWIET
ncbi:hypothetical protein THIX_60892 [Thiomonas sp. X19]|nr:hypothetical protein THIX_60892 [Thiomonas sp. X19]